jgi:hypothetical protein
VSDVEAIDLTPAAAAALLRDELARARQAFERGSLDTALDASSRALGLALQLGPAPTEQVLAALLDGAHQLASDHDALCRLGPAVVDLVRRVHEAGALPTTPIMEAWATVAADLGTLVGQLGLALALPAERRAALLAQTRARAALLDEATGGTFSLGPWLEACISVHKSSAI